MHDARRRRLRMLGIETIRPLSQGIVFHLMEHPTVRGFHQCVTINSFSQKWAELAYNVASICGFYFIPVVVIVICYSVILRHIDSASRDDTRPRNPSAGSLGRESEFRKSLGWWGRMAGVLRTAETPVASSSEVQASTASTSISTFCTRQLQKRWSAPSAAVSPPSASPARQSNASDSWDNALRVTPSSVGHHTSSADCVSHQHSFPDSRGVITHRDSQGESSVCR